MCVKVALQKPAPWLYGIREIIPSGAVFYSILRQRFRIFRNRAAQFGVLEKSDAKTGGERIVF